METERLNRPSSTVANPGNKSEYTWISDPDRATERVIILFNVRPSTKGGTPVVMRPAEFLGKPPLEVLYRSRDFSFIGANVRFGYGDVPKVPYAQYPTLSTLAKSGQFSTEDSRKLWRMVKESYYYWRQYVKILETLAFDDMENYIRFDSLYLDIGSALELDGIFFYPPDISSNSFGVIQSFSVGKKDFISMGLLRIEVGMWKLFVRALENKTSFRDRKVGLWRIAMDVGKRPIFHLIFRLSVRICGKIQNFAICVPPHFSMWMALAHLLIWMPLSVEDGMSFISEGY
jgi:hypothetical protein